MIFIISEILADGVAYLWIVWIVVVRKNIRTLVGVLSSIIMENAARRRGSVTEGIRRTRTFFVVQVILTVERTMKGKLFTAFLIEAVFALVPRERHHLCSCPMCSGDEESLAAIDYPGLDKC